MLEGCLIEGNVLGLLAQAVESTVDGRPADGLGLVVRIVHLLTAMALVGGAAFQRFVLLPAVRQTPQDFSPSLAAALRGRWAAIVGGSAALLLVTGLYTYIVAVKTLELKGTPYHMLFGIKFLLAMYIFFMASLLAGRTGLAERMRQKAELWLTVNLLAAVVVVALGSMMKATPKHLKSIAPPPNAVTSQEP